MGTTPCLFSCARPGKPAIKKVRGFLSLPGELRNQIYRYYFEFEYRCEVAAKGSNFEAYKPRTIKLWAGAFQPDAQSLKYQLRLNNDDLRTIRISRSLGKYNIVQGLQTNWFNSLFALSLVCKQTYTETVPFLYKKTTFVFDAPNRITNFLNVVSNPKLEYITKLELHYATYGSPSWNKDRIWQEKHARSWTRALKDLSKKLVGLQELKIWICVNDYSPRFNLRESWVSPLLQFRRLVTTTPRRKALEAVKIVLRTRVSHWSFEGNQALVKASAALHRLFGQAISSAVLGAKEDEAIAAFEEAWNGKYAMWQYHLGFGKTEW
ncbi:hypothetical protein EK21DRAFT_57945 [Setomelanomma holmii]|uniref:DUF7730 domain-containing protein n=1 Tax=Setomelanomma holmii TaxID=210430 RepID=A0A9P4HEQ5_9PLEO|nr:hypothetical protein EK21DRAFT_57945 [Setomelanomma holmii]